MATQGLSRVTEAMAAAAVRAGRDPGDVKLVVVTKGRTRDEIMEVYDAGQRDFGENRAQELVAKMPDLPDDIRWHFIGRLQRNKAIRVAERVVLLHSLDRLRLAETWARAPTPPPVLLEVNVGREPQKAGVLPDEAEGVLAAIRDAGVDVTGLMTIAPVADDPVTLRPLFAELASLRERLNRRWPEVAELSMGMTDDFEVAIEEGASIVRVGRAIFETKRVTQL